MPLHKVSVADKFELFSQEWEPKIVGDLDNYQIKLVKLSGEFIWHSHRDEDELFFVVDGAIDMHYRDEDGKERVERFGSGEFLIVPRGVEHKPVARAGTKLMLIERNTVVNTGGERNERTVKPARI
ncbi:MAG TPA: cupin domain-containing protein [Candidatus Acidoferrales bacterium]|nr:cupin domain-containing protein [Candidatus Acidoferrales bacterium]